MRKKPSNKKGAGLYLSVGLIAASVIYVLSQYTSGTPVIANSAVSGVQAQSTVIAHSASGTKVAGTYANGTYTGSPVSAFYGTVQVQATMQNGQLISVKFLQYPTDRTTSRSINSRATLLLANEAIAAQSAQVNAVSGATFTTQAFEQSLASALSQAQA